jgi:hypothetical protein
MQSIRRGTTPTLQFTTTLAENDVDVAYVTIRQGEVIIEKTGGEVAWFDGLLVVSLSQEETLSLAEGMAQIQIRVRLKNTQATATQIVAVSVNDILKEGVI